MFRERCSLRLSGLFVFARLLLHKMASDFLPQKIEEGGEGEGGERKVVIKIQICISTCAVHNVTPHVWTTKKDSQDCVAIRCLRIAPFTCVHHLSLGWVDGERAHICLHPVKLEGQDGLQGIASKSFPSSVTCASASFHWLGGRQAGCRRGFLQYFSKPLLISIGQNWKIGSITFKYYISKILVKWVLLQMWKCVPDMECGSPSSSYMDDRQARFRARVGADRFASTLPYMSFLRRLWKVLLIECCNMWTWNTTFTHGLRSLAWLPDKIEWVERDDGVCVIASQPFLNLHSEHFKVKTKEMLLPDKWWSSLRADASRSNQQM